VRVSEQTDQSIYQNQFHVFVTNMLFWFTFEYGRIRSWVKVTEVQPQNEFRYFQRGSALICTGVRMKEDYVQETNLEGV
jgi:hypothetical protein